MTTDTTDTAAPSLIDAGTAKMRELMEQIDRLGVDIARQEAAHAEDVQRAASRDKPRPQIPAALTTVRLQRGNLVQQYDAVRIEVHQAKAQAWPLLERAEQLDREIATWAPVLSVAERIRDDLGALGDALVSEPWYREVAGNVQGVRDLLERPRRLLADRGAVARALARIGDPEVPA